MTKTFTWARAMRLALGGLASAALIAGQVPTASAQSDVADGVAAVVNGDVITFSQVREVVSSRERALRSALTGKELVDKVREARLGALKDLIDRQLILQEFKKKEFQLPEHIVNDRIQTIIREEFGGDRQAFVRTLQAQGYSMTRFRDVEREKIIVQAMRYNNVEKDFIVSPTRVSEVYGTKRADYTSPEQIKLRMIVINKGTLDAGGNDPQRALAEEVHNKLAAGANFDQVARVYSEDSSRETGGDWGWIERKTLNERLAKTAFQLRTKQVSPVIEQDGAYYILMTEDRKNAVTKPLGEVRDEISKKLTADQRQQLQQQWLEGLRQKAYIKIF